MKHLTLVLPLVFCCLLLLPHQKSRAASMQEIATLPGPTDIDHIEQNDDQGDPQTFLLTTASFSGSSLLGIHLRNDSASPPYSFRGVFDLHHPDISEDLRIHSPNVIRVVDQRAYVLAFNGFFSLDLSDIVGTQFGSAVMPDERIERMQCPPDQPCPWDVLGALKGEMLVSADGNFLFVVWGAYNAILIVDLALNEVVDTTHIVGTNYATASLSSDRSRLAISNIDHPSFMVFDIEQSSPGTIPTLSLVREHINYTRDTGGPASFFMQIEANPIPGSGFYLSYMPVNGVAAVASFSEQAGLLGVASYWNAPFNLGGYCIATDILQEDGMDRPVIYQADRSVVDGTTSLALENFMQSGPPTTCTSLRVAPKDILVTLKSTNRMIRIHGDVNPEPIDTILRGYQSAGEALARTESGELRLYGFGEIGTSNWAIQESFVQERSVSYNELDVDLRMDRGAALRNEVGATFPMGEINQFKFAADRQYPVVYQDPHPGIDVYLIKWNAEQTALTRHPISPATPAGYRCITGVTEPLGGIIQQMDPLLEQVMPTGPTIFCK